MDKQQEAQADSISTVGVTVKEYPPSEVYSSEPPPAYQKPRATAVQIARIAAATVITVSFILGFFMLASAYITATYSCSHLVHQEQLQQEVDDQPQYQHLVDPLQPEESSESKHESLVPPPPPQGIQQELPSPIQIKLPLQLDFDEIAGSLMERNQRSRMNCVVEKRRAEEVMDHQPKTVHLPFGVNVTTDPRYEHVTGERMAIFCESGHDQRHVPMDSMATPIVVPVPVHHPVPMAVPVPHGPHGPQQLHHAAPPMMHHNNNPQQPPQIFNMQHNMPPPMMQHAQPFPHPAQTQAQMNHIPLSILTRIAQEEAASDKDDAPIHIIAREEHIVPVFHPASPEGRAISSAPEVQAVPSDMVRPPPLPFQRLPVHIPQQAAPHMMQQNMPPPEPVRPHYVHPRSVRSVDNLLHRREKRVRRCACDCSC